LIATSCSSLSLTTTSHWVHAELHSQNTTRQPILIILQWKGWWDNLITGLFVTEYKNNCWNQIWTIIIYQKEMPNWNVDYFLWMKS
jgi:hypothetical protein